MLRRTFFVAVAAVVLSSSARAEDCPPLKSYGTVQMTEINGDDHEYVPVEIAGVPKLMAVDTGADNTTLKPATASELHLSSYHTENGPVDITGHQSKEFVSTSLKVGAVGGGDIKFSLETPYLASIGDDRVVGLLGADIMGHFDVSIDFGAHTFALLSQDHCDGRVVYWPEKPIAVLPFVRQGDEIILTVTLDGHEMKAQLDTGADTSTLIESKAHSDFGVDLDNSSADGGHEKFKTSDKHQFKTLSLAGLEISNPHITVIADKISPVFNDWSTGSMVDAKYYSYEIPPMLLGLDVLRHLHIYIAYREKKLYITPAGPPPAGAPGASSPAPTASSATSNSGQK